MTQAFSRSAFLFTFLLTTAPFIATARADEKVEKPAYWLSRGYIAVKPGVRLARRAGPEVPSWPAHSLAWPVPFEDNAHSIGNSMAEFQSYGDGPYYHGGCDLRVSRGTAVHTPVAGKIEAGHYGYSAQADGSMQKFWYPWPQTGDPVYFEVSVVTDDGYRFEFHHMDETKLSPEVLKILKGDGHAPGAAAKVAAGTLLGNTISWPDGVYHHTHYNILTPSGVQLNPEYYSPLLPDHAQPQMTIALASFKSGGVQAFGTGRFAQAPDFFAVGVTDRLDGGAYDHPPVYAGIQFENGKSFAWDFRERLMGPDGKFPALWSFFVESISSDDGQNLATEGGYGEGVSVVRIPVPAGASGKFTLKIADQAGNSSELPGSIGQ